MAQFGSIIYSLLPSFMSKRTGLVDTSEGYFNLAKQCTKRVSKMTLPSASTLKFNHGQCRYLAEKLNLAVFHACFVLEALNNEQVRPQKDVVGSLEEFKLLYALAMEVENIIQSCCNDAWTLAALTLTDVSEHISSIGFDLELWRLLCFRRNTRDFGVEHIFRAQVEVVKEHASVDKETLLRDVHALLQRKKLSIIEHERASLLLERLERSRLTLSGDSVGSSQSIRSETVMSSLEEVESLGKGSAGTVYRALWLGAEFAKKTFYGNFPDFEKEVSILTGLSHPNIAPLICHGKGKRECSIVMELMDGDLFTLMQRRLKDDTARDSPFGILEAVDIMHQLAEGMHFLHKRKIVHRDLKSMNVLVKCVKSPESKVEYVQIKVADFGMSRIKEMSRTYSNQTPNVGTTRWMAPEIIRCSDSRSQGNGEGVAVKYPFKCDVYSFAMVCYEILSGNKPFSNINPNEVKKMVLDGGHPELPTECPGPLKDLIGRCWSLDASQQPKFGDICAELRQLKFRLLAMLFASSNISPPLNKSSQARDSTASGSESRVELIFILRPLTKSSQAWDSTPTGSSEGGSSSLGKHMIFDTKITPNMLAFLDNEDSLAGCPSHGHNGISREQGWVYRVPLQDDLVVAIECVPNPADDYLAQKHYWALESVGFIRHRNLVQLLAYVFGTNTLFLVYEFVPGGSLDDALIKLLDYELTLSWPQRHRILCGVARGLAYLHDGTLGTYFVHRDLNSTNIQLDEGYEAKIGDFSRGSFKSFMQTERSEYNAPEGWWRNSKESDVFSFGVVIVQLMTLWNPAWDYGVESKSGRLIWHWRYKCQLSSDNPMEAIDHTIRLSGCGDEILRAIEVAMLCTNEDPERRPTSSEALEMLLQIRNPDTVPGNDDVPTADSDLVSDAHARVSAVAQRRRNTRFGIHR